MAKRLQVILKDPEYREIQCIARSGKKLDVIRAAAQHDFPSGDIAGMLVEIEGGYGTGPHP
jgi:hypothetical protein